MRNSGLSSEQFKFKVSLDYMRLFSEKEREERGGEKGRGGGVRSRERQRMRERILCIIFNLIRHCRVLKC